MRPATYVIVKGHRFYRWNERRNDAEWSTLARAIRWPNKRVAASVAASCGGTVARLGLKGGR